MMLNKKNCFSLKVIVCLLMFSLTGGLLFGAKKKADRPAKMPEWIETPATVFPSSKYFAAVGTGPDRDTAEVKAVSGIASIFNQSVKSETQASKRMVQAQADGKVATAKIEDFNQKILKKVDVKDLIGVEIKEYWFDNKETHYAVAVMDKVAAAQTLEDMIRKNSAAVAGLLHAAESGDASIETFSTLDFACYIAEEDENLWTRLSVIDSAKANSIKSLCQSSKAIAAKRHEVAKTIPMFVAFQGDVNGRIESAYVSEISKYGFIPSFDKNARYVLTGMITFEESETKDKKTTRCRYNLDSFILDRITGDRLLPYKVNGREGSVSYDDAKERAVKAMEKKIHGGFSDAMKNYFRNFIVQ